MAFGLSAVSVAQTAAPPAASMTSEGELVRALEASVSKGGYEEALAMLQGVIQKQPLNAPARFFLATSYQAKQKYSACIKEVETSEQLGIVDDRLLGVLWVCLHESGRTSEALATASRAVAQFPQSGESHRWYGVSLLGEQKDKDSMAQFQQALRLDSNDATALYLLAQLYRSSGMVIPSLLTYLRFFVVEPEGARAQKGRAQMKAMLDAKLVLEFTSETQMEARLSLGSDAPNDEGDFGDAQRALAIYAATTRKEPVMTPAKLAKSVEMVLRSLGPTAPKPQNSFTMRTLAPYFLAIREAKMLAGLASVALPDSDQLRPEAIELLRWSASYRWEP